MTRKELLKYCRYYKGESTCPFSKESNQSLFWAFEKEYVECCANNDDNENWEAQAKECIKRNPSAKNILTREDVSIHTKGIAVFVETMIQKWLPYDNGTILTY